MNTNLSANDRQLLDLIRLEGAQSVNQLCEQLGVTATAIRQRLTRLAAAGLLDRQEERHGRGRPVHKYLLTELGRDTIGDNFTDFARALWAEVQAIDNDRVRETVIEGVASRLVSMYESQIEGVSTTDRLQSIAELFNRRGVPFVVDEDGEQPRLKIVGCPYPKLSDHGSDICDLEQKVFSALVQAPLDVDHCTCDSGGQCCTFQQGSITKPAEALVASKKR
ncbi:MAG: helix-turn-helix transcriptional regulator [Pirellulaceae bacterium]